jgi:small multidrug resistance pump
VKVVRDSRAEGACCVQVSGTTCMKLSNGFERVVPSIFVFVSYLACFTCLTYAMKFWQVHASTT